METRERLEQLEIKTMYLENALDQQERLCGRLADRIAELEQQLSRLRTRIEEEAPELHLDDLPPHY